MAPVLWILAVGSIYAAFGFWIFNVADAIRRPNGIKFLSAIATVVLTIIVAQLIPLTGSYKIIATCAVSVAYSWAHYRTLSRKCLKWQEAKLLREMRRQTVIHLVLLTGSVIFIFPFIWLVSTSVKEDVEIFRIPPVWLPTQQVKVKLDGKDRKIYESRVDGQVVTVALLKELNDDEGHRLVRVITSGKHKGHKFMALKPDLKEIRHIAPVWANYPKALNFLPPEYVYGLVPLWNTTQIVILSILGTIFSSSLVAYSFARLKWPGRDILFGVLLATMMIPGAVTMLPVFLIFRWLGWVDTLRPLWAPSFCAGAFGVFLLRQFFMTIPNDLEDAAKIDGCSLFGIYWRIMLPLIKPALAALVIMSFIGAWSNFMGALIYINSPEKMPLAYALALFAGQHGGEQSLMMAASTLVMLPVLIVFFFTQRYFIQGITLTGIKG
ncbi:MAG: carbohydrate ABC transporter permease [Armatimonadota bacterium]|nr:carbohydrate ABC transporter permease [Armatimonadota bacterium]